MDVMAPGNGVAAKGGPAHRGASFIIWGVASPRCATVCRLTAYCSDRSRPASITRSLPRFVRVGRRDMPFRSIKPSCRSRISISIEGRRCVMLPSIASKPANSSGLRSEAAKSMSFIGAWRQVSTASHIRQSDGTGKLWIVPGIHASSSGEPGALASLSHRTPTIEWTMVNPLTWLHNRCRETPDFRRSVPDGPGACATASSLMG